MTGDRFDELERFTPLFEAPESSFEEFLHRRDRKRRSQRIVAAVTGTAVVVAFVSVLAVVVSSRDAPTDLATSPAPAGSGLIAFVGTSGESRAESDAEIYVVAPDGTGLRALTSTPGVSEMAPAWSRDGTRLAFLRDVRTGGGELVIVDPSTGEETFSAGLPIPPVSDVFGPPEWSPDGRRIVLGVLNWGSFLIVDLETSTWTTSTEGDGGFWGWSPDGRWFLMNPSGELLLVPADLLGTTDLDDVSELPGVLPLPVELEGGPRVTWKPDSSAVAIGLADSSIDVVTIADGQRRRLIEDGVAPSWSPDGSQIAYLRCLEVPDPAMLPHDTVPADMAGVAPMQPGNSVWVAAADGTGARPVATSLVPPIWSPGGRLLIVVGEDGLFTVRPDGTGMTRLTRVMTPTKEGPGSGTTCGAEFFAPVWQPVPPSAEVGAEAAETDATETMLAPVATEAPVETTPSDPPEPPVTVNTPASEVSGWLGERSDEVAFVVSSTAPSYWRLAALSAFDGTTWGVRDLPLSDTGGPLPAGVEPGVDGEPVTQTFEITGLDGQLLPTAFAPVRVAVDGSDGIFFEAEGSTLVTTSETTVGLEYTVESLMPRYDVADLRAANAAPSGTRAERHLALPADFPVELAEQARAVAAGATTRYDQAIALQNWFRDFTYDVSFSAGHSQDAMVEFVAERRGYCEQFAGTFAAFARLLGLPSRIAVGFTPGEQGSDGRYHVRGEHAHSWPEIYFEGVGWVPFEPTPGRGIPGAEQYTGVPAAQSDNDNSSRTTSTAPP